MLHKNRKFPIFIEMETIVNCETKSFVRSSDEIISYVQTTIYNLIIYQSYISLSSYHLASSSSSLSPAQSQLKSRYCTRLFLCDRFNTIPIVRSKIITLTSSIVNRQSSIANQSTRTTAFFYLPPSLPL